MERRLGFVGVIIDDRQKSAQQVNAILGEHAGIIVGRMGIPYARKSCCVITLIVDASTDELGALTGKLGALKGVSVKSALGKTLK